MFLFDSSIKISYSCKGSNWQVRVSTSSSSSASISKRLEKYLATGVMDHTLTKHSSIIVPNTTKPHWIAKGQSIMRNSQNRMQRSKNNNDIKYVYPLHGPGYYMNSFKIMYYQVKSLKVTWLYYFEG